MLLAIVGAPTRQYTQDDDHAPFLIEAEAHPPLAHPQPPLTRAELADVARPRVGNKAIERVDDTPPHRRVEPLEVTPGRRCYLVGPAGAQSSSSSRRSSSEPTASPRL